MQSSRIKILRDLTVRCGVGAGIVLVALPFAAQRTLAEEALARDSLTQAECASHTTLARQLERRNAEVPVAGGLARNGKLLQVFAARDGSSWTVVVSGSDGRSCVVAAGRYWQRFSGRHGPLLEQS